MNKAPLISFSFIEIGKVYEFEKRITNADVMKFAELTGDYNPLHVDCDFGEKSIFKKNVAHGMLISGFFSTLIGMYCPGEKSLYLNQSLSFRSPVFIGDIVLVRGTVISKNESIKIITLKTQILKNNNIVIDGEAKVKVLE